MENSGTDKSQTVTTTVSAGTSTMPALPLDTHDLMAGVKQNSVDLPVASRLAVGSDPASSHTASTTAPHTGLEQAEEFVKPIFKDGEIILEVECGQNKAAMYLSKLCQGSKGPCILFQGSWLTPNEFQFVSGRETAKDWKRSIRHHGKSLKLLLAKGILSVHPTMCDCEGCRIGAVLTRKGEKRRIPNGERKRKATGTAGAGPANLPRDNLLPASACKKSPDKKLDGKKQTAEAKQSPLKDSSKLNVPMSAERHDDSCRRVAEGAAVHFTSRPETVAIPCTLNAPNDDKDHVLPTPGRKVRIVEGQAFRQRLLEMGCGEDMQANAVTPGGRTTPPEAKAVSSQCETLADKSLSRLALYQAASASLKGQTPAKQESASVFPAKCDDQQDKKDHTSYVSQSEKNTDWVWARRSLEHHDAVSEKRNTVTSPAMKVERESSDVHQMSQVSAHSISSSTLYTISGNGKGLSLSSLSSDAQPVSFHDTKATLTDSNRDDKQVRLPFPSETVVKHAAGEMSACVSENGSSQHVAIKTKRCSSSPGRHESLSCPERGDQPEPHKDYSPRLKCTSEAKVNDEHSKGPEQEKECCEQDQRQHDSQEIGKGLATNSNRPAFMDRPPENRPNIPFLEAMRPETVSGADLAALSGYMRLLAAQHQGLASLPPRYLPPAVSLTPRTDMTSSSGYLHTSAAVRMLSPLGALGVCKDPMLYPSPFVSMPAAAEYGTTGLGSLKLLGHHYPTRASWAFDHSRPFPYSAWSGYPVTAPITPVSKPAREDVDSAENVAPKQLCLDPAVAVSLHGAGGTNPADYMAAFSHVLCSSESSLYGDRTVSNSRKPFGADLPGRTVFPPSAEPDLSYIASLPDYYRALYCCQCTVNRPEDVRSWSVEDVAKFVATLEGCSVYAEIFREQRVDGKILVLLTVEHLMRNLGMKFGPAVLLTQRVARLLQDATRSGACDTCLRLAGLMPTLHSSVSY